MKPHKPIVSEMTKSYESAEEWIFNYLSESNEIMTSKSMTKIRTFRYEVWDFLHSIESRWMSKGVWKLWFRRRNIISGYRELRDLELKLARRLEDLKRERIILQGMKKAALPEEDSQTTNTRKVSGWHQSPKRYPALIKRKIKEARLPESMGE